jgi:putative membrane protein
MADATDTDVTRRTHLAAERTWLAWWRSGIAAAATAVAVGGVVPRLVEGTRWPFVVLGIAYAALSVVLFLLSGRRQREVDAALEEGGYVGLHASWVTALTAVSAVLSSATIVAIVIAA